MLREKFPLSEAQILWIVFFTFLIVRVLFVLLSGYDNFELFPDTSRYNRQSDAILAGEYNLLSNDLNQLESLFITAPFYPAHIGFRRCRRLKFCCVVFRAYFYTKQPK
jgi:hypothetical protein